MTQIQSRPPRLTPEAWAHAREDFLAGVSAAVVAERYGTTERSIRRRAAIEGWRRSDFLPGRMAPPPPWMAGPKTKDEEIEIDPALAEVDEAETVSRFALLFNPNPRSLRNFAFRHAAESAAVDRPQQAVAWMRLVQLVNNADLRLESDSSAFRDIDHVRAAYLHRLNEAVAEDRDEALTEEARRVDAASPD
ncbi:hypothetical protein [Brevundimonas sp. NIBR11]|uniref:hypothetical protein n=1 Tax=Brevundimonas sp. NIBR11 TaxID=3015999 RepID=UPI0022F1235E|nr:hypothetical protein [Brevundimonas sp. NIBR11]WGM30934.1 hypothetical protein KKHFBJBL_01168 [Brevundimonas sp. NIBR11]